MRASRIFLLGVFPLLTAVSPLAAQRREFTFFAGGNLSGASGPSIATSESRFGFQGGVNIRIPQSPRLSFQTGLNLIQRRFAAARAPSNQPAVLAGPRVDAPSLFFAQVPLTLRLQRGYSTERPVRPYFVFGFYVGVRLACRRDVTDANNVSYLTDCSVSGKGRPISTDPFVAARYQDLDAGFLGELGIEVKRFSVGVRGARGLGNVVDAGPIPTSPLDHAKLWTVAVSLEYLFRVL